LDVLFTISTHYRHSDCEHFSELNKITMHELAGNKLSACLL